VAFYCFVSSFLLNSGKLVVSTDGTMNGIKKITKKTIQKKFTSGAMGTVKKQYDAEMACYNALFKCASPHLSRVVAVDPGKYTITMECMTHDLLTRIRMGSINHKHLLSDMLCGLQALREHEFAHRDIKPENVLYDEETTVYKLTDFGLSEGIRTSQRTHRGTPGYILPIGTHISTGYNWGQANDKYGIGVVAWVALMRRNPENQPKTLAEVNTLENWTNMSAFMTTVVSMRGNTKTDLARLAAYFDTQVIPMIDIVRTTAAVESAAASRKRQRGES